MATTIAMDVVLSNGVVLDASIFDERSYVEIDDLFLERAAIAIDKGRDSEEPHIDTAVARN